MIFQVALAWFAIFVLPRKLALGSCAFSVGTYCSVVTVLGNRLDFGEAFLCALTVGLAVTAKWIIEQSQKDFFISLSTSQEHVITKQQELDSQHKGVSRILDNRCDCLIHSGEDVTTLNPSPSLSAFLLLD